MPSAESFPDWTEISALGWSADKFDDLPHSAKDTIGANKAPFSEEKHRDVERKMKIHPHITADVMGMKESMLGVAREYVLEQHLSFSTVQQVLAAKGFLPLSEDPEAVDKIRMIAAEKGLFHVNLSLEEALLNHLKHGVKGDPRKRIDGRCIVTRNGLFLTLTKDPGKGFDANTLRDPLAEGLEEIGGRGLTLMKAFMGAKILDGGRAFKMHKDLGGIDWSKAILGAVGTYLQAQSELQSQADESSS